MQAVVEPGVRERGRGRERSDARDRPAEAQAELAQAAQRDPDGVAFAELYRAHNQDTFRFLLGLLGDRGLAEDALQDAWLQIHQHLDRYDSDRPFKPWLHTVVRHAGLNALRARRKAPLPDDDAERHAISDRVVALAARQEASEVARRALEGLPSDTHALLIERYGLGLKQQELADSYDCTERTIRNRLNAALDELTRALIEARAGGDA